MTKREKFTEKYGVDPIEMVDEAVLPFIGSPLAENETTVLTQYFFKNNLDIELNDQFYTDLIEAFQEVGEKWPKKWAMYYTEEYTLDPTPINPNIPKPKPIMERLKPFIGTDELRPNFKGVYVANNDTLVATNAMTLAKVKNNEFKEYVGKIINLNTYLQSKGRKIDFIDEKYPDYEMVIPKIDLITIKNLPTYNFYNLAKSCQDFKKYLGKNTLIPINFTFEKGQETYLKTLNSIYMIDAMGFALESGFETFDLHFQEKENSAIIFDFGGDNKVLIMPIMYLKQLGTPRITLDRVLDEFGGTQKAAKPKPIVVSVPPTPKPAPQPKPAPVKKSAKSKELEMLEKMILLNLSDI